MAQFPLALSIEPRLLPLAIANGFRMDNRVRGFISTFGAVVRCHWPHIVPRFCVPQNF